MFGVSSMEGMPVTLVLEPAVASLRELFSIPAGKMSLPLPQRLDLLLQSRGLGDVYKRQDRRRTAGVSFSGSFPRELDAE